MAIELAEVKDQLAAAMEAVDLTKEHAAQLTKVGRQRAVVSPPL
jgi:hypothetical protein